MESPFSFPSNGLELEGLIHRGGPRAAVICHPHPLYGGDMYNNVVEAVTKALIEMGWSTLRFNFRGVGASRGSPGQGEQEPADVMAALGAVGDELGISVDRCVMAGYSFGAWVGLRAVSVMQPLMGWVAISPPLAAWDLSFACSLPGRKLIVCGDRDPFCPLDRARAWVESLVDPKEFAVIEGADHFFWGKEQRIKDQILRSLSGWE